MVCDTARGRRCRRFSCRAVAADTPAMTTTAATSSANIMRIVFTKPLE